jgi:hypothetical protein
MTDALRDAELLAVAAARGSEITFAAYAALREELSRAFLTQPTPSLPLPGTSIRSGG